MHMHRDHDASHPGIHGIRDGEHHEQGVGMHGMLQRLRCRDSMHALPGCAHELMHVYRDAAHEGCIMIPIRMHVHRDGGS